MLWTVRVLVEHGNNRVLVDQLIVVVLVIVVVVVSLYVAEIYIISFTTCTMNFAFFCFIALHP